MNGPGPLPLAPLFLTKVWAAPGLPRPWDSLWPAPAKTGEVWLASGRPPVTAVAGGVLQGMGLDQVVQRWPRWILGHERGGEFPLLIKILSVGDWLSVQVHPDDEAARRLEGEPWGKSEAWLVLAAREDAQIVMGLQPGVERAGLEAALAGGKLSQALAKVPARAGDVFHLEAGTVHATGPGLTIFEIQQASDVTYRFYDWDRLGDDGRPRELHQAKALEVMQAGGPGRALPSRLLSDAPNRVELLVEDAHFSLLKCTIQRAHRLDRGQEPRPRVVFVLEGRGRLASAGREFAPLELAPGQTWLVPALLRDVEIFPAGEGITVLECLG
jgi:mannose-6-phosphate isomerase